MKSSLTCVAMLLALTAFATTARAADEDQGIKDRLAEFAAAWNQHDPKALAAVWAEDGDLINPAGRHAKGRQEVEQLFSDEQEGIFKGTSFQITVESVRMLPGDIALVDANWKITAAPGAGQQPTHARWACVYGHAPGVGQMDGRFRPAIPFRLRAAEGAIVNADFAAFASAQAGCGAQHSPGLGALRTLGCASLRARLTDDS